MFKAISSTFIIIFLSSNSYAQFVDYHCGPRCVHHLITQDERYKDLELVDVVRDLQSPGQKQVDLDWSRGP